jgi:hypothetical protein
MKFGTGFDGCDPGGRLCPAASCDELGDRDEESPRGVLRRLSREKRP